MQKILYIPIDTTVNSPYECEDLVKRGDILALQIKIFKNMASADLTGQTVDLILKKSDGTFIEKTISDISNGIMAVLTVQATNSAGVVSGEVQITDDKGQTSTNTFTFTVDNAISSENLDLSENDIQTINDLKKLIIAGNIIDIDKRVTKNTTDLSDIPNQYVAKVTGKGLSTNDYDNTEKAEVAKIKNKADTTYVDDKIQGVVSGSPKAVTLVSQMIDTTKNYVYVGSESGYINGNWYYYDNTNSLWKSGGIYQSTGISKKSIDSEKLTDNVTENFGYNVIMSKSDFTNGKYDTTGTIGSAVQYACNEALLDVSAYDKLYIYQNSGYSLFYRYFTYNSSGSAVSLNSDWVEVLNNKTTVIDVSSIDKIRFTYGLSTTTGTKTFINPIPTNYYPLEFRYYSEGYEVPRTPADSTVTIEKIAPLILEFEELLSYKDFTIGKYQLDGGVASLSSAMCNVTLLDVSDVNYLTIKHNNINKTLVKLAFFKSDGTYSSMQNSWNEIKANEETYFDISDYNKISVNVLQQDSSGNNLAITSAFGISIRKRYVTKEVKKRIIIVSATDTLADYTDLKTCFDTETEGEKTIQLLGETYDILNPRMRFKKGWTVQGLSAEQTKIVLHFDNSYTLNHALDGFFCEVDGTLKNLTIESYDGEYCFHSDGNHTTDDSGSFDFYVENVVLRRKPNTIQYYIDNSIAGQAFGLGLSSGQRLHFKNCQFYPNEDALAPVAANLHNIAGCYTDDFALFEFENCYFGGKYGAFIWNLRASTEKIHDVFIFNNCEFSGGIRLDNNINSNCSYVFYGNSNIPEIKTNETGCLTYPLGNGREMLTNLGTSAISKGDIVCRVYKSKRTYWNESTLYSVPMGVEKLNSTNYKYTCGIALNNIPASSSGYIQTKDLVSFGTNVSGATIFDYLSIGTNGTITIDNTTAHPFAQLIRTQNEYIVKLI